MVRATTGSIGSSAEQVALRYLKKQGLKRVRRNFRCRRGEIDLIMLDASVLVFVEVRYRTHTSLVESTMTVDGRKQQKLINTAAIFLARNREFHDHVCRFDVVGIDRHQYGVDSINWVRDAFRTDR